MSLSIRRALLTDAAAIAQLYASPQLYSGTLQLPYPTEDTWRSRIANSNTTTSSDIMLIAQEDGQILGTAGLHTASTAIRRRHCSILGIGVNTEHQGHGVGTALMKALCNYADQWAQILRIELTVYVDNAPAIALYKKFGFVIEGTHRAYSLRGGVYTDTYCMARLHPQPPCLPSTYSSDEKGAPDD
jgi:putative acetyltransferase